MNNWKTTYMAGFIGLILALPLISCYPQPSPDINYDPSKSYAAFLVVHSAFGESALESMKRHSTAETYEIGPIEYYEQGTKDFEPILRRLTVSKQVQLVWIISSLWDVPEIKKAMAKIEYKGQYRYAPISDQSGQIKVVQ